MRAFHDLRTLVICVAACLCGTSAAAQTSPTAPGSPEYSSSKAGESSPAPTPEGTSPYCDQELGFCMALPKGWKLMDVVYEGKGVTFAPEQKGDQSLWAQVTVADIELPAKEGQDPPSTENLVTALVGRMASQVGTMRTVRRSDSTVGNRPGELIEVRYAESGHDWAEIITVVDAGEGEFYSVVFKSLAEQRDEYQQALEEMLRTFRLLE